MRRIKVLFLAANPSTTDRRALAAKVDAMLKQLQTSEYQGRVDFVTDRAESIEDLKEVLQYHYPHVVHFIGDNKNDEGVMFVDSSGQLRPTDDLYLPFVSTLRHRVRLVILQTCYVPEQIMPQQGIPLFDLDGCVVIGIDHRVEANSALRFVTTFYRYVNQGFSTQKAFNFGEDAISSQRGKWPFPELKAKTFYNPEDHVLLEMPGVPIPPDTPDEQFPPDPESGHIPPVPKPIDLLVVYAHEDQELRNKFMDHLKLSIDKELIGTYYDGDVTSKEGQEQLLEHLNTARVILLLVSMDFLNSDFINNSHLQEVVARHRRGEAYVILILLRPVSWEDTPFSQLPRLPRNNRAINLWKDRYVAFSEIIESIRLILKEQGPEVLPPVDTGQSGPDHPLLADVFVRAGIPKVTYVESGDFGRLKLALSQKGRSVVVEGPAGIGKTTAIQKAIEQIRSTPESTQIEIKLLRASNSKDVERLGTIETWHRGTVVIDDFHHLDEQLSKKIVDHLKLLADTESETKKLVIIGIPQSGQKLVDLSFDVANRVDVFPWGKEKDEIILQMIGKGEQALNIQLKHKMELAILASGSLNMAQFLCYEVCYQEEVKTTQSRLHVIDSKNINIAVSNVITALARKFEEVITFFARMGGTQDSTCLRLLEELVASENWSLDLLQLKEQYRELSFGIGCFISGKWMETLYQKYPQSKSYIFFDPSTSTLVIDDPQLAFYLQQVMSYSKLARVAGIEAAIRRRTVFICYCKEDRRLLETLQKHLQPLENMGIDLWDDTKLPPGAQWEKELSGAIETATVAILLVSSDFLASDFIVKYQLPRLLKRAEGGTRIISLIARPSLFEESKLNKFSPFNPPDRALSRMKKADCELELTRLGKFIKKELEK